MSRVVVFFTYSNPVKTGPVSLGFTGDDASVIPFEADLTFVVEHHGDMPCVVGRGSVITATFNYGELSMGLDDLDSMELGFGASGEVDMLNCAFTPVNTLSSIDINITCTPTDCVIRGTDRDTGQDFEYCYVYAKQSASRVPTYSSNAL